MGCPGEKWSGIAHREVPYHAGPGAWRSLSGGPRSRGTVAGADHHPAHRTGRRDRCRRPRGSPGRHRRPDSRTARDAGRRMRLRRLLLPRDAGPSDGSSDRGAGPPRRLGGEAGATAANRGGRL